MKISEERFAIAALRERNRQLEAELAAERERADFETAKANGAGRALIEVLDKNANLREALEPFVIPRDGAHSGALYNDSVVFAFEGHKITVRHFRRARAVLEETGSGNE